MSVSAAVSEAGFKHSHSMFNLKFHDQLGTKVYFTKTILYKFSPLLLTTGKRGCKTGDVRNALPLNFPP